jgi:hypothetical protein
LTGCGFVVVVERRQENTFFAEGRSAVAGMPLGTRPKEKKQKRKEKNQKKRKDLLFLYISKRYLKDYYIYIILVCGESVVRGLVHTLATFVDSIGV